MHRTTLDLHDLAICVERVEIFFDKIFKIKKGRTAKQHAHKFLKNALYPLFDLLIHALAVETVLLDQLGCRTRLAVGVIYTQFLHRSRLFLT